MEKLEFDMLIKLHAKYTPPGTSMHLYASSYDSVRGLIGKGPKGLPDLGPGCSCRGQDSSEPRPSCDVIGSLWKPVMPHDMNTFCQVRLSI